MNDSRAAPDRHQPPPAAVHLLHAALSASDRDDVIGDLTELYADRVDARRRFNRAWFWAGTLAFAGMALVARTSIGRQPSGRSLMERVVSRLHQAGRRLRHDWRFSLSVVFILAIGIGPAAAMFGVFDRVLLRPLDYREPERVALLRVDLGELRGHPGLSMSEVLDLRAAEVFDAVEAETRLVEVSLGTDPDFVSVSQIAVTVGMLDMLGVRPVIGRTFVEADLPPLPPPAAPGQPPAVLPPLPPQPTLLDFVTWQTHFGGDPNVVGRIITVNARPSEIVGVLPDNFRLATGRAVPRRIDLYTPLRLRDVRNSWMYPTLARLKPGVTLASTQAALDAVAARNIEQFPESYQGRLRYTVTPVLDDMTTATRPALRAAVAAVGMLLVIALANATALIVARLRTRESDLAIRSAMGATRAALVWDVFAECVLLAGAAAGLGGLFAVAATAAVRDLIPRTVPRWDAIAVGWDLMAYTSALAGVSLIVAAVIPVWKVSRGTVAGVLRRSSVQGGRELGTLSRLTLVGVQIAVTVVLAFGCAQLLRSAAHLSRVNLGYDPDVLTFEISYDRARHEGRDGRGRLYQQIRNNVAAIPGVLSAGVITHLPLSGSTMMDGYQADLSKEPTFEMAANYQAVTPGYFATLRIPFLEGRDFTDQEVHSSQPVVVVDELLKRTAFPGEANVVGRVLRLGWGLPNAQIVGVVGHARTIEVGREVRPQVYAPISSLFQNAGHVVVRATGDRRGIVTRVVAAINEAGPGRAVSSIGRVSDNVDAAMSTLMAVTGLVTSLAASAGLLSAVGLFLVVSFLAHQRRRATAIRTALGASRRQVLWQHVRTSGQVMAVAVPAGVMLSLWISPLFGNLVYGVSPRDGLSLLIAAGLALLVSLAGTWVPARRAARSNIVRILRET